MKQTSGEDFEPEPPEWDALALLLTEDLQRSLDSKLISAAELKEAIWRAEASGDVFVDAATDVRLACLMKPVITYWVEYRRAGPQTYEIESAYYHRMRLHQGE